MSCYNLTTLISPLKTEKGLQISLRKVFETDKYHHKIFQKFVSTGNSSTRSEKCKDLKIITKTFKYNVNIVRRK